MTMISSRAQASMRCYRRIIQPQISFSPSHSFAAATTQQQHYRQYHTSSRNNTISQGSGNRSQVFTYNNNYYSTSSKKLGGGGGISTAQLVKQLRESTGAPMMECKKALSSPEVNNDIELAKEWLRKHGSAKALSKVAGREALEGLIGMHISTTAPHYDDDDDDDDKGVLHKTVPVAALVKVSSETDFASRSTVFSNFVQEVAIAAATTTTTATTTPTSCMANNNNNNMHEEPSLLLDIPSFLSNTTTANGKTLYESLNDTILAIRENLSVENIAIVQAQHSQPSSSVVLGGYVHGKVGPDINCGSAAAIVELEMTKNGTNNAIDTPIIVQEAAKKLAMHIVAAKPLYVTIESVPIDVVQKEKDILRAKMEMESSSSSSSSLSENHNKKKKSNTPEIQEKILHGQLRKFYESVCLTEQAHMVEEGNPKVGKVLQQLGWNVKKFHLMSMNKS